MKIKLWQLEYDFDKEDAKIVVPLILLLLGIQDMGYYPHGSFFFSDLTHYVRSGDFVLALLHDSKDLDGYAFALGALAHYASDNEGHPIGTNRSVPLLYPKLQKRYGDSVTYEEDKLAHVKTEFGFDVLEVAHGRYAPDSYHDFIGFGVSSPSNTLIFQGSRPTFRNFQKDLFLEYGNTSASLYRGFDCKGARL